MTMPNKVLNQGWFTDEQAKIAASSEMEALSDGDRKFFERHPHRVHRIRRSGLAEYKLNVSPNTPEDYVAVTGVKCIGKGLRVRIVAFLGISRDADFDMPEDMAKSIFEAIAEASGTYQNPMLGKMLAALRP